MPLNSQSLPTDTREEFCLALKAARERKGITLDQIADATKISACLFAALERSDLGRWPAGLFRRSFFRDYVRMIGAPETEACAAFVRLFNEDEVAEPAATPAAPARSGRPPIHDALRRGRTAIAAAWAKSANALTHMFDSAGSATPQPAEEPEPQPWVTDARRVGPARLRVRIRLPR